MTRLRPSDEFPWALSDDLTFTRGPSRIFDVGLIVLTIWVWVYGFNVFIAISKWYCGGAYCLKTTLPSFVYLVVLIHWTAWTFALAWVAQYYLRDAILAFASRYEEGQDA